MGIFARKNSNQDSISNPSILAQYAPQIMGENLNQLAAYITPRISRTDAMKVSSVARCRNLISGTIAGIPIALYRKSTGEEIGAPVWLDQPSLSQPRFVTMAWTVDSLMMYGVAYWEITEVYEEDGRAKRFEWVANTRVTFDLDLYNTTVNQYYVDGFPRPMSGLGSLVTFQSFDEGILSRGGATIQAALDIQNAASIAARTPMPTGYIKNTGADLDPKEVQGLLAAWKQARQNRSTAYLTSTLEYNIAQFSPKDMMYNEAQQYLATEIARLCNVPAYYISADMNNSMTYANVLDERKQFFALSLKPYTDAISARLSMNDVTANGNEVKFEISDTFLKVDPLEELAVIEKLLELQLITTEQAAQMTELTPNGMGNEEVR
jgi:HK97 family phage portal protein